MEGEGREKKTFNIEKETQKLGCFCKFSKKYYQSKHSLKWAEIRPNLVTLVDNKNRILRNLLHFDFNHDRNGTRVCQP
jgi:hypothetical protein